MTPADWMSFRDQLLDRKPVKYVGTRTMPYMDDYLLLYPTEEAAKAGCEILYRVLDFLGLSLNEGKSTLTPTQRLRHLGIEI